MDNVYPKAKYGITAASQLVTHTVKSEAEEKSLPKGWVDSPAELGIETAPSAPSLSKGPTSKTAVEYPVPENVEKAKTTTAKKGSKEDAQAIADEAAASKRDKSKAA